MVEIIDNKLQQAYDFRDECNAVYSILENLKEQDYEMPTQFKGWTFNNVYWAFACMELCSRYFIERWR